MKKINRRTIYLYQFLFLLVFIPVLVSLSGRPNVLPTLPLAFSPITVSFLFILNLFFIGQSIFFRARSLGQRGWKRTLPVLSGDYLFDDYATINLISLIYAFVQGFTLGAAWSAYAGIVGFWTDPYPWADFAIVLFLLTIPLIAIINLLFWRVILEGVVIYFKAMHSIIQQTNQFAQKLDPSEELKQD